MSAEGYTLDLHAAVCVSSDVPLARVPSSDQQSEVTLAAAARDGGYGSTLNIANKVSILKK